MPTAPSTPSPRPTSEATRPTRAASSRTERNTWRRLAPTIRSRASSLVRWPTRMEKVLKMVKPPTNREMKANTNKRRREEGQRLVDGGGLLGGHGLPGDHLDPGGQHGGDRLWTAALSAPGRVRTSDGVVTPGLPEQLLGGGQVEGGQGGSGQVVGRPEPDQAGDEEGLRGPGQQDPHVVPYHEVVLRGRPLVHDHLVRGGGGGPGHQLERGQLGVGIEGEAEGGRPPGGDGLAVRGHELGVAAHTFPRRRPPPVRRRTAAAMDCGDRGCGWRCRCCRFR